MPMRLRMLAERVTGSHVCWRWWYYPTDCQRYSGLWGEFNIDM
jgi:hypothetical protein